MDEDILRIAVDGPSGAGKSTIAKIVAKKLNIDYIDTGAMYRAIGLKMMNGGVSREEGDTAERQKVLDETTIDFDAGVILLDGEDVSGLIRTP